MRDARNLTVARAAWGDTVPDWIDALATACDRSNQTAVARQLGVSGSAVSGVLNRNYKADLARIEQRVRGVLMSGTVACPVLGDLASDLCLEWQAKASQFRDTGSLRRRMYAACRRCPRSRFIKESISAE
jgi:hypothetical protein